MDWITDTIAIGNHIEARDTILLREAGFASILSLDGSLSESEAECLGVTEIVSVELMDGAGNDPRRFDRATASLGRLIRETPPVLVHCHAGRSRSVAVVAAHFVVSEGCGPSADQRMGATPNATEKRRHQTTALR